MPDGRLRHAVQPQLFFQGLYFPFERRLLGEPLLLGLITALGQSQLITEPGLLFVQHQTELDLPESSGRLILTQLRGYGNTALGIYELSTP